MKEAYTTEDEIKFINHLGEHCEFTELPTRKLLQNYLKAVNLREVWEAPGLSLDREAIIQAAEARLES